MQVPADAASTPDKPQFGVFGPLVPQHPINYDELEDEIEEEEPLPASHPPPTVDEADKSSLKRQVDSQSQLANGSAAKRPRLGNANGLENGADAATSPMEIDQHQSDNHAYPSPLEGEQAPTPAPRTEGPDHGTQTDKVDDLEAKTVYLRLAHDDSSSLAATPIADVSHPHASQNPILLHCEWNPKDPSRLAAAGTDALARVWTVSRATGPDQVADHVDPDWPSINLVTDDFPPHSKVTVMAWGSDGKDIAVATDDGQKARVDLWNLDGRQMHTYTGLEAPIVKLRCNPVNRKILSITPISNSSGDTTGWMVTVFPSPKSSPVEYEYTFPPDQDVDAQQPDAVWTDDHEFFLSVGSKVISLRCTDTEITQSKELSARTDDPLTQIQCDGTGHFAAARLKGDIDVSLEPSLSLSLPADRTECLVLTQPRFGILLAPAEPSMAPMTAKSRFCSGSRLRAGHLTVSCYSRQGVKMVQSPSGTPARLTAGPDFNGLLTTTLSLVCPSPQTVPSSLALQETES